MRPGVSGESLSKSALKKRKKREAKKAAKQVNCPPNSLAVSVREKLRAGSKLKVSFNNELLDSSPGSLVPFKLTGCLQRVYLPLKGLNFI